MDHDYGIDANTAMAQQGKMQSFGQAGLAQRVAPPKPLDAIAVSARRVDGLCDRLNAFLNRFHDNPPSDNSIENGACLIATHIPYARSLDRLSGGLERLETLVNGVESIG